jgi:hypothetical protein
METLKSTNTPLKFLTDTIMKERFIDEIDFVYAIMANAQFKACEE